MNPVKDYFRELLTTAWRGWLEFWFTPTDTTTLGLIRICTGAMLLYTHLVWSLDLEAFFGPHAWLSGEAVDAFYRGPVLPGAAPLATVSTGLMDQFFQQSYAWTYFRLIQSQPMLWAVHIAALVVFLLLTLGYRSRLMSVLAWLAAVSYVHRVPAALFGLDQINCLLAMYLMVGPCGASYSLDRWLARRRAGKPLPSAPRSVSANVAIRLIQVHMCVIYLFAGLSKLAGPSWWDGFAIWLSFANLEYQSLDMTWMAGYPLAISFLTHLSVMWEVSYAALVWPRLTRPIWVALSIPLHLGIALCLGMMTFGLIMLVGNLAFISPSLVRGSIDWLASFIRRNDQRSSRRADPRQGPQAALPRPQPAASELVSYSIFRTTPTTTPSTRAFFT